MILFVDTSEKKFDLKLYNKDGQILDHYRSASVNNHTDELLGQIKNLLDKNGSNLGNITKIIAVVGPGSYTGIRVGVSSVNGIAFALNIPAYGIAKEDSKALQNVFTSKLSSFEAPIAIPYEREPHITVSRNRR